ncbi:PREDICTED: sulfotransferase 1C4-like [Polistes dominula]|uniref:Sulfotransferase 1C4-like n=1 Tax=Polistes dominula TaxID=743375 RepID=A0ABM1JH68_POLDO|nr:PREDICTED: sulfotransferase 1C4-like [Polistes dominula]
MESEIPKYVFFNDEEKKLAEKHFAASKRGFIKVGEKKWTMPYRYLEEGSAVYNSKPRPDDTWVVSFPRSGTTVTLELVWLVANNMNFEEAKTRSLHHRFPFFELDILTGDYDDFLTSQTGEKIERLNPEFSNKLPSPRFIKTHMPFELLPNLLDSECKIVYVARNPKDVVVSWYHFLQIIKGLEYQGSFEEFCEYFMKDLTNYCPYWTHLKDAWAERHRSNLLFIFYEEIITDLPSVIKKVAKFFEKSYSEEEVLKLVNHLHIDNFRKNPMVNRPSLNPKETVKPIGFIRKGKVKGWKEFFTDELEAKYDVWIKENMKDTDLTFPINCVEEK